MPRQRRHIDENQRNEVRNSDHPWDCAPFGSTKTPAPTSSAENAARRCRVAKACSPLQTEHQITAATVALHAVDDRNGGRSRNATIRYRRGQGGPALSGNAGWRQIARLINGAIGSDRFSRM